MINRLVSDDGKEACSEHELAKIAKNYFQNIFSSKGIGDFTHVLSGIEAKIDEETNRMLLTTFSQEEIVVALQEMRLTKAPEEDGFPATFFQKFWHIIGLEVSQFCLWILNNGEELEVINRTEIVLIPKTQNTSKMMHFFTY